VSTYYETLGITETASAEEIRRAYRVLTRGNIPEARLRILNTAYNTLKNPARRLDYDQDLAQNRAASASASSASNYSSRHTNARAASSRTNTSRPSNHRSSSASPPLYSTTSSSSTSSGRTWPRMLWRALCWLLRLIWRSISWILSKIGQFLHNQLRYPDGYTYLNGYHLFFIFLICSASLFFYPKLPKLFLDSFKIALIPVLFFGIELFFYAKMAINNLDTPWPYISFILLAIVIANKWKKFTIFLTLLLASIYYYYFSRGLNNI